MPHFSMATNVPMVTYTGPTDRPRLGAQVWENGAMSDMVLVARNEQFKVHKVALFQECDPLHDQLSQSKVTIDGDPCLVRYVLTYIYTNKLQIPEAQMSSVAKVAQNMGVNDLSVWCTKEYLNTANITQDNCLELLARAYAIRDKVLVDKVLTTAVQYFQKVKRSASFIALPGDLLKMLIFHKDLKVRTPDDRLSAVLNWVRVDPQTRKPILEELFQSPLMKDVNLSFLDHILDDPVVQELPQIVRQIQEMLLSTSGDEKRKADLLTSLDQSTQPAAGLPTNMNRPLASSIKLRQPPTAPSVRNRNPPPASSMHESNSLPTASAVTSSASPKPLSHYIPLPVLSLDQAQVTKTMPQVLQRARRRIGSPLALVNPVSERCLVFAGARIFDRRSQEVYAVRLDNNLQVVKLGKFSVKFPDDHTAVACCVFNNQLYMSGLGTSGHEVWGFDLNTKATTSVARLQTGRSDHAMTSVSDGRLCVFGGRSPPGVDLCTNTASVEVIDSSTNTSTPVGQLKYTRGYGLKCCRVGDQVLVCGACDDHNYQYIQVWDITKSCITHATRVPYEETCGIYGIVLAQGHIIVVTSKYTFVTNTLDVLQGKDRKAGNVRFCKNYVIPNLYKPAVVLSSDCKSIMLLGGKPKYGNPTHYVYTAGIHDVIHDAGSGWTHVKIHWTLGQCEMYGGYDVVNITLPQQ